MKIVTEISRVTDTYKLQEDNKVQGVWNIWGAWVKSLLPVNNCRSALTIKLELYFPPAALYWFVVFFFIGSMFHPHHLFLYKCILSLSVVNGSALQNSDPDPNSARAPFCPGWDFWLGPSCNWEQTTACGFGLRSSLSSHGVLFSFQGLVPAFL